jgi:hypothetical protein
MFLLLDAGIAALEIETGRDFLVGLVKRIAHFNQIGFGYYVERWHGISLCWRAGDAVLVAAWPVILADKKPGG